MLLEALIDGESRLVEVQQRGDRFIVSIEGRTLELDVVDTAPQLASLLVEGRSYEVGFERRPSGYRVQVRGETLNVDVGPARRREAVHSGDHTSPQRLTAPMPGRIVRVLVAPGAEVGPGEGVVVIEAMKMQNELRARRGGRVMDLAVVEGQAVEAGALVAVIT